jgi:hypothetical protein
LKLAERKYQQNGRWQILPPMVPALRICGEAASAAASERINNVSLAAAADDNGALFFLVKPLQEIDGLLYAFGIDVLETFHALPPRPERPARSCPA